MGNLVFRKLQADEIDCRVGTATEKGVSLLMYKDARVDMRLLDEVVGCMNWKREHEIINGNLYCTVSIYNAVTKEWVSKQDVGVESNTEKEKGQASDAFKRACFNWGIGRELYTCPFIWVTLRDDEWRFGTNGKKSPKTSFKVTDIEYQDDKVSYLRIVDDKGMERFKWGFSVKKDNTVAAAIAEVKRCSDIKTLEALYNKYSVTLSKSNEFISAVTARKNELTNKAA